jgi:hypothetical protein
MDVSCLTQAPHNILVPLFDWSDEITADRAVRRDLVGPVEQLGIQPIALDQPIEVIPTESAALVALDVQHIELADQVAKDDGAFSKPPVAFKRTLQHRAAV